MTDREERQHVIKVLKNMLDWMEAANKINSTPERIEAVKYAIASIETDLKYDLLYEETSEQADKSTTKNDLEVDAVSRQAINGYIDYILSHGMGKRKSFEFIKKFVANLPSVTSQEPTEKCTWTKYDYRTMYPKEHDADNPYWRIPENRMEALKYCPYCGKEIEVEK